MLIVEQITVARETECSDWPYLDHMAPRSVGEGCTISRKGNECWVCKINTHAFHKYIGRKCMYVFFTSR